MQYQFENFVLDPDNFQLRKGRQPVGLRAKAFHVLAFLLNNRHRMVSKDELLDEVWHNQYIAESTLNSCIKTVRQTLGDDGKSQKIIETVRGMGYRFVSPVEMIKPARSTQVTISKRLDERFDRTFVGRTHELKTVLEALAQPELPFWICYVYGSGGIGKTSVLKNLCRQAAKDSMSVYLDCREHEPTPEGLLRGLAETLAAAFGSTGSESKYRSLDDVAELIGTHASRVLLCLDQFESFNVLEAWMRQNFFPALPDTVLTVIASRQAPKTAWYTSSEWVNAFRIIELGELSDQDARLMLAARNMGDEQITRVIRFARGYPLALELAAMLYRTQPEYQFADDVAPIEVVSKLATSVLAGLTDVEKEALEALSTVHRANEPILCALLGLRDAQKLFVKLRELPFVTYSSRGIALHDVVRDAIFKDLDFRDPDRRKQYQLNAWTYFRDEASKTGNVRLWQLTADLLFLIDSPVIREAYFPAGSHEYSIQQAGTGDAAEILDVSHSCETVTARRITQRWLEKYPQHFYVAKSANGSVDAFEIFYDPDEVDREQLHNDPVAAAWLKHLANSPIDKNEKIIFYRRWVTRGMGDAMSPAQGAFWVDIKRVYMSMRPQLRRLYMVFTHLAEYEEVCRSVDFQMLDDCAVELDGQRYHTAMLDFGAGSVDGWLVRLVRNQLQ